MAPPGLRYADDVVSADEEQRLVERFEALDFVPFDFGGFKGNRRTVAFGSRYDFTQHRVGSAEPMPEWLLPLRGKVSAFAGIHEDELLQALITEYAPGAGIGWHRDRPEYGKVVGLSFLSNCTLRFRRHEGGWRRASVALSPGSAYLLDGEARDGWQHSISPGIALRYSVTFRTLR
jgi:alkylated DNA repair dioxygenase AlkB